MGGAVTPLERAARDRIGALLDHWDRDPLTAVFGSGDAATAFREDLRLVLAALDRHEQGTGSVLGTGREVAGHAGRFGPVPERVEITHQAAGPRGGCEDCSCCVASGCHTGPGSICPTDRLGDSVCPCTGD